MTYPCPFCRTTADLDAGCPGCGRGPDPDAAEVIRLDGEIAQLTTRLQHARAEVHTVEGLLRVAWLGRQAAAVRVGAAMRVEPRPTAPVARTPETSTRLVQNVLFVLGGLLLGTAAIVFTAVAWAQFGVGGRAALLAGFTVLTLAVPVVVLRRGLTATAETFAAVGLLLVLLDGYAAWYVNLFGVVDGSALGYAGAVCATTAAVAAGYEVLTGLSGPRFLALLVAQPVLPLVLGPARPDATGWAFVLAGVAAADLAIVRLHRDRAGSVAVAMRVVGHLLGAAAVFGSGVCALLALAVADGPGAAAAGGAALIVAAALPVVAAVQARSAAARAVTGGALVLAVALAAGRPAALAAGVAAPVAVAVVVAVLAALVAAVGGRLPDAVRRGSWTGALLAVAGPALVASLDACRAAAYAVGAAWPTLVGPGRLLSDPAPQAAPGWLLPVTILLLAGGLCALLPATRRIDVAVVAAALTASILPAAVDAPWWSAPGIDLAVAATVLLVAVRRPAAAAVAALLTAHAVTIGYARPDVAAPTLGALAVLGLVVAAHAGRRPGGTGGATTVGGVALAVALLAVPAAAATMTAALDAPARWPSRAALTALILLVAAVRPIAGRWPGYDGYARAALLLGAAGTPFWAPPGDAPGVYAALALIMVAVLVRPAAPRWWAAGAPPVLLLTAAAGDSLAAVLLTPYGWLGHAGTGRPTGVGLHPGSFAVGRPGLGGLDPGGLARGSAGDAVALALLAAAVAVAAYRLARAAGRRPGLSAATWAAAPALGVVAPVALAVRVPWPAVPAVSLLVGLAAALTVALRRPPLRSAPETVAGWSVVGAARAAMMIVAVALTGAGLAGSLPTRGATLVALGAVGVVGAAAGAAGWSRAGRIAGWLTMTAAFVGFAYTAGRAFGATTATTSYGVLAVAAVTLGLGAALTARRPVEATAVQAAGHAGALCALLLTAGAPRHAAVVCALWGVVLGMRALRPAERAARRRHHVVAAAAAQLAAWWLLIGAQRVVLVEAYTVPAAGVALLAGWLWLRTTPGRGSSWTAYGPALAAAMLPTCAVVLNGDGSPLRRLLFGLGALVVLLAGARARLQAPVVAGSVGLAVAALHELTRVWDLLPRWIPLAVVGLLLVTLAATVERRRQDLHRMRAAVARMG